MDTGLAGENLSTVGVDIGDLTLSRGGKEIIFSTWDFGGQVPSKVLDSKAAKVLAMLLSGMTPRKIANMRYFSSVYHRLTLRPGNNCIC